MPEDMQHTEPAGFITGDLLASVQFRELEQVRVGDLVPGQTESSAHCDCVTSLQLDEKPYGFVF